MITDPEVVLFTFVVKVCTADKNTSTAFVFVSVNDVDVAPPTAAVTLLYVPAVVPAVKVDEVAMPEELVTAVHVVCGAPPFVQTPPVVANLPSGLLFGAVNVTVAPATGFPLASVTMTDRGCPKAVPTFVDWLLPPHTDTFAAGPAVTIVGDVADVRPVADAVMVYAFELALVKEQFENVATPSVTVTDVDEQVNPPEVEPLLAANFTTVALSFETMLLNWSSSVTPTLNVFPAVIVGGGAFEYTSCDAASGVMVKVAEPKLRAVPAS
jgi:hypothetical protein